MNLLLEILYLGDGSHNVSRSENYISISSRLRNEVQELFILTGKSASNHDMFVTERKRDSYIVLPEQIEVKKYDGLVYCPSTDSGIVCVRYNGMPIWCGNCYKSEDKITDDSAFPFFQRIIKRGHTSVLEHSVVFVRTHTPEACMKLKQLLVEYVEATGYPSYIRYSQYDNDYNVSDPTEVEFENGLHLGMCIGKEHLFSGNIRAWRKLCEAYNGEPILQDTFGSHIAFQDIFVSSTQEEHVYTSDDIEIVDSIDTNPDEFPDAYKHMIATIRIISDRGIIDEYRTHRSAGASVESTRYCNYSDKGLTFVFPYWYEHDKLREERLNSQMSSEFVNRCYDTELAYQEWMKKTNTPQSARGNLILWTKSEGVFTATIQQWIDILALRDSPAAHPDARKIAKMIEKVLVEQVGVKDIWGVAENGD